MPGLHNVKYVPILFSIGIVVLPVHTVTFLSQSISSSSLASAAFHSFTMPRVLSSLLTLAATASAAYAIQCTDLTLRITANVAGIQLPADLNITGAEALNLAALNSLGKDVIGGTYNIAARFCEPTKDVESRRNTLQLLVHGVQQTKDYWSGLAPPGQGFENNDWIKWAAAEGYPTLAFDRICNGQSDHPNGVTTCQTSLNSAVLLGVIQKAASGAIGGRKFSKIVPIW